MRSASGKISALTPSSNARTLTSSITPRSTSTPISCLPFSGSTVCTSGWVPASTRRQGPHTPQGRFPSPRHSAAMAQSRATDFLPVPFGPANR